MANRLKYDLTGRVFFRLTVIERDFSAKRCNWICKCICGNTISTESGGLRKGKTKSCGCWNSEVRILTHTKHGQGGGVGKIKSLAYASWGTMIQRCTNPKANRFEEYGGSGISVCHRWINSFLDFYADMGERPSRSHTIDRIDNNGNYEPNNCRWATKAEQSRNKSNNTWIEHDGRKMIQKDWADLLGIGDDTIIGRLRQGRTFSEIYNYYTGENYKRRKRWLKR